MKNIKKSMKLEDQVVTLELAKKMKDLGFKQESLFVHFQIHSGVWKIGEAVVEQLNGVSYPAYTVAELGEMLPDNLASFRFRKKWSEVQIIDGYAMEIKTLRLTEDTEADARAKMLIYLAKQGLIYTKNIYEQRTKTTRTGKPNL